MTPQRGLAILPPRSDNEESDGVDQRMIAEGVWCDCRQRPGDRIRPGLFLDRDGTLIDLVHYIRRPEDVRLIPAAIRLIHAAHRAGYATVVVTNQSGIARGLFGWDEFLAVQRRTDDLLRAEGIELAAVLACAHAPADLGGAESSFRKPAPGMVIEASRRLNLGTRGSWIVGDNASDLAAGRNAGLGLGWLVETGYGVGERDAALALAGPDFTVIAGQSLDALAPRLAAG